MVSLSFRNKTEFDLHYTQDTWLLTQPKVASQWCNKHSQFIHKLTISYSNLECVISKEINDNEGNEEQRLSKLKAFKKDWDAILEGKVPKRKVTFLTRNPINKFVAAVVQDVILRSLQLKFITSPYFKIVLEKKFEKHLVLEFLTWASKQANYDNLSTIPPKYFDLYYYIIDSLVDDYFLNTKELIETCTDGHKIMCNQFLLKLLCYPPQEFNSEYIEIIDIERQDLGKTFYSKYGYDTPSKKENERGTLMRYCSFNTMHKHSSLICWLIEYEILAYNELVKRLYPQSLYDSEKLSELIKPLNMHHSDNLSSEDEKNVRYVQQVLANVDWSYKIQSLKKEETYDKEPKEKTLT